MNIRAVVLVGAFSIASIIIFQVYWIYYTFHVNSDQFNQKVKIALYSVAEKISNFTETDLPYNVVKQVTSNYFVVNVATHVDAKILEHYLKTVLLQHNLTLDCEYAIYNCETGEMTYGNYLSIGNETPKTRTPHEFKKQEDLVYYFGVIFPGKTNYIVRSIDIWIISAIIVFTALVFFAYAIFIILKQKRLSEIQKDFIDNMTHEFKTPISSISIASRVLQEPGIESDLTRFHRYAEIIESQNTRLEKHLERVLQIATLEKTREKFSMETFDLHGLIREVAQTLSPQGVELTTNLQADPSLIHADRFHLASVLHNLLDNAIKYSGEHPRIHISTSNEGKYILLLVRDEGPGIPPRYLKRVFDKFYRIPSHNIHTVKGFGLGLYFVKKIVEDHGWKIRIESEPGSGTSIYIRINTNQ